MKLKSQLLVEDIIKECGQIMKFKINNRIFPVYLINEDAVTIVRVHGIPVHVSNDEIIKTLRNYGEVRNVKLEMWGRNFPLPVPNGVRQVTMKIEKAIPSYINIFNRKTWVTYDGQKKHASTVQVRTIY